MTNEQFSHILQGILDELSVRIDEGIVDLKNPKHLQKLGEIFDEMELYQVGDQLIENLMREDDDYTHIGAGIYVAKRDVDPDGGAKEGAQRYRKDGEGKQATFSAISDEEAEQIKQKQGDAGEKAAASFNQQQAKDGGEGGGEGEEQERGTALDPSTSSGQNYTDQLPPEDPASTSKKKKEKEKPESHTSPTINRGGDSDIKNEAIKYGYQEVKDEDGNTIFKPAPGNAGSLLNEVISGEVAQLLEENPNLTEDELLDILYERFGEGALFKSTGKNGNSGSQPAGGMKKSEIPAEHKSNAGLYSKTMLAVRSGRRKDEKAKNTAQSQGFKEPKIENYYGHSQSFDAMVRDIKGKQVIGPNGELISQEEAEELIRSGGGGDNPSDTATLVFDGKTNRVIILFHSDKDSVDAIVAQSSLKAEAESNELVIDDLVSSGKISQEQGEQLKEAQRELVRRTEEVEAELKGVTSAPAKFFLENIPTETALESVKNDTDSRGNKDKNKTSTKLKSSIYSRGKVHPSIKPYLDTEKDDKDYTEEELFDAYLKFMADENKEVEPTTDQVTLMERLNTRFLDEGAPDIYSELEDIRNRTLQLQRDFIKDQDVETIDVNGNPVGLGTHLEANTVWKQFHLEAVDKNSNKGVHKYPGMFETNHAGIVVDGDTLIECMGGDVSNQNDFISRFEVGPIEEQKGVSGDQKGLTTGGKRIVYAVTSGGKKIPIGQKVMRTKSGKTGRLQTVYQWSDEMKDCFKSKQS